jgi:hypothetical protein
LTEQLGYFLLCSAGELEPQHDSDPILDLVLANLGPADKAACARSLHRINKDSYLRSVATLQHLHLERYWQGLCKAAELVRSMDHGELPAALAEAAAVPGIPWELLKSMADRHMLISLEIVGPQAQLLVDGDPTSRPAAAAAAASSTIMLAGLHRLAITYTYNDSDVLGVGRLVGSCSGLTQLQLRGGTVCTDRIYKFSYIQQQDDVSSTTLLEGWEQAAAAPASASGTPGRLLPHLRDLEVAEGNPAFIHAWIDRLEVSGLTSLAMRNISADDPVDLSCLAACSGLKELVLQGHRTNVNLGEDPLQLSLPEELTQATALTKLVLGYKWGGCFDEEGTTEEEVVPPVVWELTQLRHLDISHWRIEQLPESVSTLRHLTYLNVRGTGMWELPSELSSWTPQLQVLDVSYSMIQGVPRLPWLTCLIGQDAYLREMNTVDHLLLLRELYASKYPMVGPLDGITKLTALEVLELGIEDGAAVGPTIELPRLRRMKIEGGGADDNPLQIANRLLGSAGQLTYLSLNCITAGQVEELQQLGVLPVLKELHLGAMEGASLVAPSEWLQQHPHLTALHLSGFDVAQLGVLPAQLLSLSVKAGTVVSCAGLRDSLVPLTGLRSLAFSADKFSWHGLQLPPWLSTLQHLTEIACDSATSGFEVLQQLPLLRRLRTRVEAVPMLCAAPNLCWASCS